MIAIVFGIAVGLVLPAQTAINSYLRQFMGATFKASWVSFFVGAVCLAGATWLSGKRLGMSLNFIQTQPAWVWLGGVFGVCYLTGNIFLFAKLGSVQSVILPILGQIIAGLIVDNWGLFMSPFHAVTSVRFTGALLVTAGILVTIIGPEYLRQRHGRRLGDSTEGFSMKNWGWRILGVLTGSLSALQTAINGHLGQVLHSPVKAAFITLFTGTLLLTAIVIILGVRGTLTDTPKLTGHRPWWIWLGGVLGATFVFGNAQLVPILGTGLTVTVVLLGQISGSLAIDQFGLLGARKSPVVLLQLIGLAIMIMGIAAIKLTS